jgi:hypothetical protein
MTQSLDASAEGRDSWLRSTHCGGRSMGHMVVTYALPRGNAYSMPAAGRRAGYSPDSRAWMSAVTESGG